MKSYLDKLNCEKNSLYQAVKYSVNAGGKRLRMMAVTECARLFSDDIDNAVPFACAVEFIHTYSLIHDDLPAMDNAEYRRGKPTNHKVFGECAAILAGDGLLHYAFEIMAEGSIKSDWRKSDLFMRALYEIAHSSGIQGMVYGQTLDTMPTEAPDIETLKLIYDKKTASMFIGPMKAGAIISGAHLGEIEQVEGFAQNFGIAFQTADDILDEVSSREITGKDAGADKRNKKVTVTTLLGLDAARIMMNEYMDEAKRIISPLDKYGFFTGLCDYVINQTV